LFVAIVDPVVSVLLAKYQLVIAALAALGLGMMELDSMFTFAYEPDPLAVCTVKRRESVDCLSEDGFCALELPESVFSLLGAKVVVGFGHVGNDLETDVVHLFDALPDLNSLFIPVCCLVVDLFQGDAKSLELVVDWLRRDVFEHWGLR
jgi:hypothetical protein